jgi:DNA-binding transcriptional LysR family regulator
MGVLTACGALDLAGLLAAFHHDHPGAQISLSEDNSDRLLTALRRGRLDVAVIGSAGPPHPDMCTETLIDEPLVAAVGSDDPLVGQDRIALADLCERDLISMPDGTGLRARLDQACAQAGLSPRIALQAGDPNVLARLAGRGLDVAILAESMAGPAGLHAVTVVPGLRSRVELVWRAARALIAHARVVLTSR